MTERALVERRETTMSQQRTGRLSGAGVVFGLLASLSLGCSETVRTVDLTQPEAIDKAVFEGQWYFRQTVVDVAPEVAIGFVGLQGGLEKVRWELTETELRAYRTYEAVPGTDQDARLEGGRLQGDRIATFPIRSHFDILREYNANTGEPSNVISENSVDRPWWERQFVRIDWAGGAASSTVDFADLFKTLSTGTDYVRAHEIFDPDHIILDEDRIQFTVNATLSDGGFTCFVSYGNRNCGSGEVRIRYSFAKIDPAEEAAFAPRSYFDGDPLYGPDGRRLQSIGLNVGGAGATRIVDFACTPELFAYFDRNVAPGYLTPDNCQTESTPQFERFGFFRTERYGYDRRLGAGHDLNRTFYANIHPIWQNPWQGVGAERTPTPAADLRPRPIIYYVNADYPPDLEPITAAMMADWDVAFMGAVTARTGKSEGEIRALLQADHPAEAWRFLDGDQLQAGAMFQIRRNTCSVPGIEAYLDRFPKLRGVVEEAADGQALKRGNLQRVCSALSAVSRQQRLSPRFDWEQIGDVRYSFVNWIDEDQPTGPLGYGPSSADPESGRIISGNANVYGAAVDAYARSAADIVRAMNEDLDLAALVSGDSYAEWLATPRSVADMPLTVDSQVFEALNQRLGGFKVEEVYGPYKTESGAIDYAALERQIHQRMRRPDPSDPVASAFTAPVDAGRERLAALHQDPHFQARMLDEQVLGAVRPLLGLPAGAELSGEDRARALALVSDPVAHHRLAEERLRRLASQNIYAAEFIDDSVIGQALSLKGLDPEEVFRQLREEIYRSVMLHEIGHTLGMTHNFKGSFDALNYQDEFWQLRHNPDTDWAAERVAEFRYSSIMDYGARFNSNNKGLGKYDLAAIKYVYGGVTEEFAPEVELPSRLSYSVLIDGYQQIPELLKGYENIRKRVDRPIEDHRAERAAALVRNTQLFVEGQADGTQYWVDRQVPYEFCFDVFRGNLGCRTWDEGATHAEGVRSAIQNYWNYYVFNNYRRGRTEYAFASGFFNRQARLADYLTYPFRYFYFYQQWDIGLRNDLYEAALIGLNFINQVLGTPLPGRHCFDASRQQFVPLGAFEGDPAGCDAFEVPEGVGRPLRNGYTDEYYYRLDAIGSYLDKFNFLFYLNDTSTSFFRVSNLGDMRTFSIGYYRVYREELVRLMRDMVFSWLGEGDGDALASLVETTGKQVVPRILVDAGAFSQTEESMAGMSRLFPPLSYNLIWQALLVSTVFNTSTYDSQLDFVEYLAISEVGSGDDRELPEAWQTAVFVHPRTHVTYRAAQTEDGQSIAYELLQRAQRFADEVWIPAREALEAAPEDRVARAVMASADQRLEQYADLMSELRWMRSIMR